MRSPADGTRNWSTSVARWEDLIDYELAFGEFHGCLPHIEQGPNFFTVTHPGTGDVEFMHVDDIVPWTKHLQEADVRNAGFMMMLRKLVPVNIREVLTYELSSSE